ncbi:MAG: hypothetical protein UY92_C0012G0014 [Candidatus Magasanikbacteria bacterium GW2011_GWA2_56_11]|uniref:Uncharacterized protein n=1 Tax=Candidatus Magasanikbacteria bacterium GW2011_GWA2_56_11 TaxID=1619044 RepID=A0A0G1YFE9_9BACT|nr:MAG: hypothetical protein UY92_C0012G0014 [Candidatus Magasanikbacteria bacterium GW2011_GWA2_56_11]
MRLVGEPADSEESRLQLRLAELQEQKAELEAQIRAIKQSLGAKARADDRPDFTRGQLLADAREKLDFFRRRLAWVEEQLDLPREQREYGPDSPYVRSDESLRREKADLEDNLIPGQARKVAELGGYDERNTRPEEPSQAAAINE